MFAPSSKKSQNSTSTIKSNKKNLPERKSFDLQPAKIQKEIINYKSDKSLTSSIEDKFKHSHYVKVLKDIITKCETPINIGLYGRWGVGKSSIAHMLKEEIKKGDLSNDFIYAEVDAWGLSKNALQQGIIEEINSQIPNSKYKQSELEEILFSEREISYSNFNEMKKLWPVLGIGSAVAAVVFSLDESLQTLQKISALGFAGIASLVTVLLAIVRFFHVSSKRTIPKAISSLQFKNIYKKIVETQLKQKKLIVVIDNLDRCDDRVAVSLLGIIQSFMAIPNCINILACDDEAIVNHLTRVHGNKYTQREGNEFLSKFFQVTIRIPPFIGENLEKYTEELMKDRNVPFHPYVKHVLISGAIENPRKINQFLNNVVALYRLADMKELDGRLPDKLVTKNTHVLTKIIIIRHEWPLFFKALEKNPKLLKDRGILNQWLEENKNSNQIEGLEKFLNMTQVASVEDLTPFLRLNQETYATEKEIDEFGTAINTNDLNTAQNIFAELDDEKKWKYLKKIDDLTQKNSEEDPELTLMNNAFVILGLFEAISDQSQKNYISNIFGRHVSNHLLEQVDKFEQEKLLNILLAMEEVFSRSIFEKLIENNFTKEKFSSELAHLFFKNVNNVPRYIMNNLDSTIASLYQAHEDAILKIIENSVSPDWISNNITKPSNMLTDMIKLISFDNGEPDNKRIEVYKKIHGSIDISEKEIFIKKLTEITKTSTESNTIIPQKIFELINEIIIADQNIGIKISPLFDVLIKSTEKNPNLEQKKMIFEILFQLLNKFR